MENTASFNILVLTHKNKSFLFYLCTYFIHVYFIEIEYLSGIICIIRECERFKI